MKESVAYPGFDQDCNRYSLDQDVKSRLSYHLSRTRAGNQEVFITPIGKNNDPQKILKDIDNLFSMNSGKINAELAELEDSNKSKYGPRSIAVPWKERITTLTDSFGVGNSIGDLRGLSGPGSLRTLDLNVAVDSLKNNTNSGLPSYTRKSKVKEKLLRELDEQLNRKYPCILFTRTQEGNKTRNVWGYPMCDTLNEMKYYKPLLSHQRVMPYRAALHKPEIVDAKISQLVLRCNFENRFKLISIDFSSYDATVKSELQKVAFDYIRSCFQPGIRPGITAIEERFLNIGIWTPDGIISGKHGVPSGSTFTNEVDSIVQATIAMNKIGLKDDEFQVQGDDGAYLLDKSKSDLFYSSFEQYGLSINRDKSHEAENSIIYLQRLYHMDYMKDGLIRGIYPIYRALNRLVYQERWQDFEDYEMTGKDYYSIRSICILENCKNHPLFEDFVNIVLKYDKYSLDYSDQGLVKYIDMLNKSQGARDIQVYKSGSDPSGIRSFETVKLINKIMKNKA